MRSKREKLLFAAALAVLIAAVGLVGASLIRLEKNSVLGVEIRDDADGNAEGELAFSLLLNGAAAPYDSYTDTYYIPQTLDRAGWSGTLSTAEGYELSFVPDEFFEYRPSALEYCHVFRLCVSDGTVTDAVNVMFTGLPALCLESSGEMRLFCPDGSGEKGARTVVSACEFHVRGYESELWPKSSWKLTLFDENGAYYRAQLLGMRADDDWILMPMYGDRTKVREKLAMDLWNGIAATNPYALESGANAEYVEVFIDGNYAGLYLLAQRVDAKLSGGDADDTVYLFDGPDVPEAEDFLLTESFFCRDVELRSTHAFFESGLWDSCALWTGMVFGGTGTEALPRVQRPSNICDYYIFTSLVSSARYGFQSFYLTAHDNYGELSYTVIPTDFKFSFGCGFSELKFCNNTVYSGESAALPTACPVFEAYASVFPEKAEEQLCRRYLELEKILDAEKICGAAQALRSELVRSGAAERDRARWPESDYGAGMDELCRYIEARLEYMDSEFSAD
ncbi:MAG: CotH kinase family protein [Clostridiales bacterium]|nr:CotH kinase family protein [Clostridiales bacterium]